MKSYSHINQISIFFLLVLNAFCITNSFSQHVLTFKNGTELKVFITYQTKDTLEYYLASNPNVKYIETANNIYKITPVESKKGSIPDSLKNNEDYMKYLHYKRVTNSGLILIPVGVLIGGLGTALAFSASDPGVGIMAAFAMGLGGGLIITGIIKSIAGSVKMHKYKNKVNGFSFDLKCTPQEQGMVSVYRF